MKRKSGILLFCLFGFSTTAYANSSWHWHTDTPLTILPWVVLGTLVLELWIVCYFNNLRCTLKPLVLIIFSNLASFLLPYMFIGLTPHILEDNTDFLARINITVRQWPFFTVNIAFLLITSIIEIPIIYFFLKNHVKSKKRLIVVLLVTSVITTSIVAVIERVVCYGSW